MQRLFPGILLFFVSTFTGLQLRAQCEPDTSCTDINEPGEFCPAILPDVVLGEPYEAVLTIVPPSVFDYDGNILDIVYIQVDSVLNFPPGLDYEANADTLYADSAYCILVTGIPTEEGKFPLEIYITPTIQHPLTGMILGPQVIDKTSVVITVTDISGTEAIKTDKFTVYQNVPNPFSGTTRIGYNTIINSPVELKIYNILGELIYEESHLSTPGEHFFLFNGSNLMPGPYFYSVSNLDSRLTRKFIKTR